MNLSVATPASEAQRRAEELRAKLRDRIREAVGAEPSAGWALTCGRQRASSRRSRNSTSESQLIVGLASLLQMPDRGSINDWGRCDDDEDQSDFNHISMEHPVIDCPYAASWRNPELGRIDDVW